MMMGIEQMMQHHHQEDVCTPQQLLDGMGEDLVKIFIMLVKNIQPDESGWSPLSIRLSQYMDLYQKVKATAENGNAPMPIADWCQDILVSHKLDHNSWWQCFTGLRVPDSESESEDILHWMQNTCSLFLVAQCTFRKACFGLGSQT